MAIFADGPKRRGPAAGARVYACNWSLFPVMDTVAAARFAVAEGFAGLEIECDPLGFWPTMVSEATVAELAAIADGEGIGYTLHASDDLNPASALPEWRARDATLIARLIELAVRLGSPVVGIHPGVAAELFSLERKGVTYETARFDRARLLAEARRRAVETIAEWAALAGGAGLVIPVENEVHVRHTVAPTAETLAAMVAATGRDNVRVNLDTGHAFIGAGLVKEFTALRDHIVHMHLNDGRRKGVSEHLPLGEGTIDLAPVAGFMAGFGGALVLEIYAPERAVQATLASRDHLLRVLAAAEGSRGRPA